MLLGNNHFVNRHADLQNSLPSFPKVYIDISRCIRYNYGWNLFGIYALNLG